ncbi:hypothetical protein BXZ70DRAFT_747619 [Cristinia sonorae]|uniref:Uncharacterized protein n=1 Tax=Cristinia sonorae TaxID=1940300 RepID=A0A8K0UCZ1_9AGAR|nr:hypothetical protein BXZ70DRAFT_747619 [Cristinia sonorae]
MWFISTPNCEYIPELPRKISRIQYYEDGMMGALEFFKWPQEYDHNAPYAIACPANPDLLYFPTQSFFNEDVKGVLPHFSDKKAPWFHISGKDFVVTDVFPTGEYGRLTDIVLKRIREALLEIINHILDVMEELNDASGRDTLDAIKYEAAMEACENLQARLRCTYTKLFNGDLTPFETILLFREFQRVLLALRGWVIYVTVLWPRIRNTAKSYERDVLPVRGLFSDDEELVKTMFRIGVPVWYIRHTATFSTRTTIVRSVAPLTARMSFSALSVMRLGQFNMNAPSWRRNIAEDPSTSSLLERLERVSVSNHALIAQVQRHRPEIASILFNLAREGMFSLDRIATCPSKEEIAAQSVLLDDQLGSEETMNAIEEVERDNEAAWQGSNEKSDNDKGVASSEILPPGLTYTALALSSNVLTPS